MAHVLCDLPYVIQINMTVQQPNTQYHIAQEKIPARPTVKKANKKHDPQSMFINMLTAQLNYQTPDNAVDSKDIHNSYMSMAQLETSQAQLKAAQAQLSATQEQIATLERIEHHIVDKQG